MASGVLQAHRPLVLGRPKIVREPRSGRLCYTGPAAPTAHTVFRAQPSHRSVADGCADESTCVRIGEELGAGVMPRLRSATSAVNYVTRSGLLARKVRREAGSMCGPDSTLVRVKTCGVFAVFSHRDVLKWRVVRKYHRWGVSTNK